ncbi:MAG TPA: amidohydrolase family protein, partial [Xanthobacteraceae bacterium]
MNPEPSARTVSSLALIDVHHHVLLPEYQQALIRSGAGDPSRPFRRHDGPSVTCEKMAELGIEAAVVNPLSVAGVHHGNDADARYLCRSVNEALARFVSAEPRRLGFFATLPMPDVDGALAEMNYALDVLGADGVILLTHQNGSYVGDPAGEPLYAEMDRRATVCFVHPTIPAYFPAGLNLKMWPAYIEYAFDTTRVAANLIYHEQLRKFPAIRWLLAHAGGAFPYLSMRLRLMEELETKGRAPPFPGLGAGAPFDQRVPEGVAPYLDKFYFDVALSGADAPMAALTTLAPANRIFYGSDWPFVEKSFVLEQQDNLLRMTHFSGERFAAMERENAIAQFGR